MHGIVPRSPVIPTLPVVFSKDTMFHHQLSIRQSQRETTLIHHLPTIRRNQRDQLMDIVMNAEAIMMTTASDVPRPLIVSNALREYQTTLSEKQRD